MHSWNGNGFVICKTSMNFTGGLLPAWRHLWVKLFPSCSSTTCRFLYHQVPINTAGYTAPWWAGTKLFLFYYSVMYEIPQDKSLKILIKKKKKKEKPVFLELVPEFLEQFITFSSERFLFPKFLQTGWCILSAFPHIEKMPVKARLKNEIEWKQMLDWNCFRPYLQKHRSP